MAAACKPVVLAKLICFGIVCGSSLAKRKIDIKNDSLKNIGNYSDINKYRKELSSTTTWNVRGERCICDHAKHLEDFLDLTTGELRFYLQQRALTCHGNHADLAARALVAFEQNLPIKKLQRLFFLLYKGITVTYLSVVVWQKIPWRWRVGRTTCLSGQNFILGRSSAIFREQGIFNRLQWPI